MREWPREEAEAPLPADDMAEAPDQELAVATLVGDKALFVERAGWLVAAVELVSPRNKDRPSAYGSAYLGYLLKGVNLLLVDVHRRPAQFSFADWIARELRVEKEQPPLLLRSP